MAKYEGHDTESTVNRAGAQPAIALTHGYLTRRNAKTTHGLLRGSSRYRLTAVVDPDWAGQDAGQVAFGRNMGVPVVDSVTTALGADHQPQVCIIGVATPGGALPQSLRQGILEAADAGLTLVNGLHHLLSNDEEIAGRVAAAHGRIIDIRRPQPVSDLRFWSGAVYGIRALRLAVLGTDCALGKRTTTFMLRDACRHLGRRTEMIYTGQTGWLQGLRHGLIFDATPNDFVCGELERALLNCAADGDPDIILMEGQSGLRNPSGPCGPEFLLAGDAQGVILQHAPGRRYFEGMEDRRQPIRPVREDVELIHLYGSRVLAITLSQEGLTDDEARAARDTISAETGLLTVLPLLDGLESVAAHIVEQDRSHAESKRL